VGNVNVYLMPTKDNWFAHAQKRNADYIAPGKT